MRPTWMLTMTTTLLTAMAMARACHLARAEAAGQRYVVAHFSLLSCHRYRPLRALAID